MENEETIEPKIEAEKTKKSGKYTTFLIIAILLVFISIFAITKIRTSLTPQTIDELHLQNLKGKTGEFNYIYNGYSFVNLDNMWYFQLQEDNTVFDVPLRYGPKEVENISIDINMEMIDAKKFPEIYLTIDPFTTDVTYQTLAVSELGLNLVRALNIIPRAACYRDDNISCTGRDIINCSYEFAPIIYVKQSDTAKVSQENNCYIIEGKEEDLLKSIDRFIYKAYNIMP